jgi:hypothetical protein
MMYEVCGSETTSSECNRRKWRPHIDEKMTPEELTSMDLQTYRLLPDDNERARFLLHIERASNKPAKYAKKGPQMFVSWGRIVLKGDNGRKEPMQGSPSK